MKNFDHISGEYLEINGAKIYYELTGQEDHPILLFLHGGFGTIEDFNIVLPSLTREFRVIGVDSRGQGKSALGTDELTYERIQKDVERILEHLNIDSLSIIGFSDGGIVAYRLAVFSQLKIEKIITIGSRWHLKNTAPTKELFLKITGESWRKKFPENYEAYQKLNPAPNFDNLAEKLIKMWLDSSSSGYANEEVKNIALPLLIVRGDDDHLLSLDAVCELKKHVKGSKLLNIPFAGHAAFQDQKEIFMLSLNEFLNA